jgi:NADH-quinone oxidoreductase subunit H
MTEFFQSLGMTYDWAWFVATVCGILLIALPLMLGVAMIIYADRKIWAAMALRRGPNVVGPFGLLQSFADGLKVFLQETIIPSAANKGLFLIAPIITFTVALLAWAVIPFNSGASWPISTSACSMSSRSRPSASTARSSPGGLPTRSIPSSRPCAPRRR